VLRRALEVFAPLCLFGALAIASTWPLLPEAGHSFPLGTERSSTVTFASAWALWWTSDRAAHGFEHSWDAPIFYPTEGSFAFSEPMPALGLLAAPLLWAGLPLCLAYNLVLLGALSLNGDATYRLLRALGLNRVACLSGGAFVTTLPVVHHELGVLTLVPLFGLLLALRALFALCEAPRCTRGVALGLALTLTYACCAQYAAFLAWSLALSAPSWARKLLRRAALPGLGGCVLALALGAAPIAYSQRQALAPQHFSRSEQRARDGAGKLVQWVRAPWRELVPTPLLRQANPGRPPLYPGTLRVGLMLVALVALLRERAARGFWPVLGALALSAFVLSVLPHLAWHGFAPFDWLRRVIPGLALIRSLWRAGIVTQLVLTLFAALGVHRLWELGPVWKLRLGPTRALTLTLVALATIELWPPAQALSEAPSDARYAPLTRWIEAHVAPNEPLAYLPFPQRAVSSYEETTRFMLLQRAHGRPMVNGYSSFFPAPHERLLAQRLDLGAPATAPLLRAFDVRFVVVTAPPRARLHERARAGGYSLRFASDALNVTVYELPRETRAPAPR